MKKVLVTLAIASTFTGCGVINKATLSSQDFTMTGSAEGIRAYNDGVIGMARTAKESPDKASEYMAARGFQEKEITKRETSPGFLGQLFGASTKPTQE